MFLWGLRVHLIEQLLMFRTSPKRSRVPHQRLHWEITQSCCKSQATWSAAARSIGAEGAEGLNRTPCHHRWPQAHLSTLGSTSSNHQKTTYFCITSPRGYSTSQENHRRPTNQTPSTFQTPPPNLPHLLIACFRLMGLTSAWDATRLCVILHLPSGFVEAGALLVSWPWVKNKTPPKNRMLRLFFVLRNRVVFMFGGGTRCFWPQAT